MLTERHDGTASYWSLMRALQEDGRVRGIRRQYIDGYMEYDSLTVPRAQRAQLPDNVELG